MQAPPRDPLLGAAQSCRKLLAETLQRLYRLTVLGIALAGLFHTALMVRAGAESGAVVTDCLAWLAALLAFRFERPSSAVGYGAATAGLGLLAFALLQSARMASTDLWLLKILPFLLVGGGLLSSQGPVGLWRNCRLWAVLAMAAAPNSMLAPVLDHGGWLIREHARLGGFLLHYAGFDVRVEGSSLFLPTGAVRVEEPCSGFGTMMILLKLALIACIVLPLGFRKNLALCASALGVGFAVGVVRVSMLTAAVAHPQRFALLHGTAGGNLFPAIAFLCYLPILLLVETPLVEAIRQFRTRWLVAKCAASPSRLTSGVVVILVFVAALVIAFASDPTPDRLPAPLHEWALRGQAPQRPREIVIQAPLRNRQSNSVDTACQWDFQAATGRWTVLICSVSSAFVGPRELLRTPDFCDFVRTRLLGSLPANWKPETAIWSGGQGSLETTPVPSGLLGLCGIDARGRRILTTGDYCLAQTMALKDIRTWAQWLATGRRIQDARYWLVIIAGTR